MPIGGRWPKAYIRQLALGDCHFVAAPALFECLRIERQFHLPLLIPRVPFAALQEFNRRLRSLTGRMPQRRGLMMNRQKSGTVISGTTVTCRRRHTDKAGQVFVLRPKSVTDPCSHRSLTNRS